MWLPLLLLENDEVDNVALNGDVVTGGRADKAIVLVSGDVDQLGVGALLSGKFLPLESPGNASLLDRRMDQFEEFRVVGRLDVNTAGGLNLGNIRSDAQGLVGREEPLNRRQDVLEGGTLLLAAVVPTDDGARPETSVLDLDVKVAAGGLDQDAFVVEVRQGEVDVHRVIDFEGLLALLRGKPTSKGADGEGKTGVEDGLLFEKGGQENFGNLALGGENELAGVGVVDDGDIGLLDGNKRGHGIR